MAALQQHYSMRLSRLLTSLVAHERSQVDWLGAVIAGEGLHLALSTAAALPGAEAQGTTPGVCILKRH